MKSDGARNAATALATYTWLYDAGDRITRMTSNDGTVTYSHDATDQLKQAEHGTAQPLESYSYDRNGNRTGAFESTAPNRVTTYTKDANTTYTYAYDNEGNCTSRTKKVSGNVEEYVQYDWDHRNRLTHVVVKPSSSSATITKEAWYTYDVFDRRLTKTVDDGPGGAAPVTTRFVYDGPHLALVFEGASSTATLAHRYLHGPMIDEVLADEKVADSSLLWPLTDHLGTVRDLATAGGAVPPGNHVQYDSFGNVQSPAGAPARLYFAYTGREWDRELDQHYYRGRYYDPRTGTFLSEDPISFGGGDPNLYRYVGNSPAGSIDPFGLTDYQILLPDGSAKPFKVPDNIRTRKEQIEFIRSRTPPGTRIAGVDLDPEAEIRNRDQALAEERKKEEAFQQEQRRRAERNALAGVAPDPNCNDLSGPPVTKWFAQDLVEHIKYRKPHADDVKRAKSSFVTSRDPGASDLTLALSEDLKRFRHQAANLMGPKWVDFGSPVQGKGVNTVILADTVLRKNQLGNIELAVIGTLYPPFDQGTSWTIDFAYNRIDPPGNIYSDKHAHADHNFGYYKGLTRVDNLAAFGVGHEIALRIMQLDSFRANGVPTVEEVEGIIRDLFKDEKALLGAINRFSNLYPGDSKPTLTLNNLTFIEYYGGFNTASCRPPRDNLKEFEGPSSIDNHLRLQQAYEEYKKSNAFRTRRLTFEKWREFDRENYSHPKGFDSNPWHRQR